MIDNLNTSDYAINFDNDRFILFNAKDRSEHVISIHQAAAFDHQGVKFTAIARHELEEAQYEEAIAHYLGED